MKLGTITVRLGKTGWVVVLGAVSLLAATGLYMVYSQENSQQGRLSEQVSQAQLILKKTSANLPAEKKALEDSLSEARSEVEMVRASLSPTNESIEASRHLFDLADACNVVITDVTTSVPGREKVNGVNYSVLPLAVRVQGAMADVLEFVATWTAENPTGQVQSVVIAPAGNSQRRSEPESATDNVTDNTTVPETLPLEELVAPPPGTMAADVRLAIYRLSG